MGIIKQAAAGIGLIGVMGLLVGCTEVVVPGSMAGGGEYSPEALYRPQANFKEGC